MPSNLKVVKLILGLTIIKLSVAVTADTDGSSKTTAPS